MSLKQWILRTLASAGIAGCVFAADLVLLVLLLNPGAGLLRETPALLVSIFLPYAAAGAAVLSLCALLGALFRFWPAAARPPLPGQPWFTTLSLLAISGSAVLYWVNLLSYRFSIPDESVRTLAGAAVGLTVAALTLAAIGIDVLLFPFRSRGVGTALVVLAAASAVVVPLALLPEPAPPSAPVPLATEPVRPVRRLILVGIDGLGPAQLTEGVSNGRFPAFAHMVRRGVHGPLATIRPTEGPPLWTTIFTGQYPRDHGVKSFSTYRLLGSRRSYELLPKGALVGWLERAGLVARQPVTAASRRQPALWNALNAFGIGAGVVRIWGTFPTEPVQGFMLSHYFHVLLSDPGRTPEALHPADLLPEVTARAVLPDDVDQALVSQFVDLSVQRPDDTLPWRRDLVARALAPDMTYERAGAVLRAAYDPPFFATYYYGLDVLGHTYMRFGRPDRFGDVSTEQVRRYGQVWDQYAAYLSQRVGRLIDGLREGEILIVVSTYGMEPVPLWRRLLSSLVGGADTSGTHSGAPDGVILAIGDGVRAGVRVERASILDLAPTVLYLMGLPVARDMEGRVLTELVVDEFARSHPVTFIPSYQSLAVAPAAGDLDLDLPLLPDEGV